MVTGLLFFLARHLTLVGIDSDEGKPKFAGAFLIFFAQRLPHLTLKNLRLNIVLKWPNLD